MPSRAPVFGDPVDVSAVVVTRNEEGNITGSLESVFRSLDGARRDGLLSSYEVLLVDSASTDQTVSLASEFPVTILRLRRDWPLSTAAGRATGARHARGRLLFFVDGDYRIDETWVTGALELLQDPSIGGVCGYDLEDVSGATMLAKRWAEAQSRTLPETTHVDSIATGFVRREAYDAVGGIHPYLRGAEDRDLGLRMTAAGWRVLRTQQPMGVHRLARPGEPITYIEYFRSVAYWSSGEGQACRARWSDRGLRQTFLRHYTTFRLAIQDAHLLVLATLFLLNALGVLQGGVTLLAALAADATAFLGLAAWKSWRGWTWRETLYELHGALYGPLRQTMFLRGFLRHSPSPESYPSDVDVVQRKGPSAPVQP